MTATPDDLVFVRGGATGFTAVSSTLISFLGSFSNTIERGLGIGVGLERDEALLISSSSLSAVARCGFEPGRTESELLSSSCDVCCVEG